MHEELIKASNYYKNRATGWVVVCNGQPSHFLSKHEAAAFAKALPLVEAAARADERKKCAKLVVNLFDPEDGVAEFIAKKY